MIIGVAGHIDHGKTALVQALTGVDTDRLAEEKRRGISIELGFAYLAIDADLTLGFVDVPGHERFVHAMVAGASGVDFALLVVAADDGVMPQTREHLAILDLLGVGRGLIAISKADLVSEARLVEVAAEIRAAVAGSVMDGAEILPVSALTGFGLETLKGRLATAARSLDVRSADAQFRLAVDRVFTLQGVGVVVTGAVLSGEVRVGDRVTVSPSGLHARVRSLHAQNRPAALGRAGDRCAINLAGEGVAKAAIHRGEMVLAPAQHAPTERIDARLLLLASEPRAIGDWFPARLHHASAEVGARIVVLDGAKLAPGGEADVQLVLDRSIAAAGLDRFVVRDVSARRTIGGGCFLDLRPPTRRRRTPERRLQRAALAMSDPVAALEQLLAAPPFVWDLTIFARDRALSEATVRQVVSAVQPVLLDDERSTFAIAQDHWRSFCSSLIATLTTFHADNPDQQGIGRDKLRQSLQPRLSAGVFAAALLHPDLSADTRRDGAFVRLASHTVRLTPQDEAAWEQIAPLLGGEARFRPPRVRDVAGALPRKEQDVRRLLKLAARIGRVDQIANDHFFLRSTVTEMAAIAKDVAEHSPDGVFTAAQFRDRLDNGRKVAIQVLEFFDRHGVTHLKDDHRRIDPLRADLFNPHTFATKPNSGRDPSPVGRSDFKSE